jgi:NADPH:quinone reductase-like Zn-dependent oxidoreductase
MNVSIPETMQAVELRAYDGSLHSLHVVEKPVPMPSHGQVLIRVAAAPINPSDLLFLRGLYGFKKALPVVPGFEGSGTVVARGGGFLARMLEGRRVACAAASPDIRDGTWAEYVVTSAQLCIPLRRDVELEQAAMMLVNPLSAWALVDIARRAGHRAVVQTAAASALGRMLVRLGQRFSLTVVNIVRRSEQVETLRALGVTPDHVLNSTDNDFDQRLKETCHRLNATLGFDAVGGEMTGRMLRAMPRGSRALVYGDLSLESCRIDSSSLIFEGKKVDGFWLSEWLRHRSLLRQLMLTRQVQNLLAIELKSDVQGRFPLEAIGLAISRYSANMSGGKVLLIPGSSRPCGGPNE